ncbi:MAG: permease [Thermoprotei archaeon]|nr:MAG: permease [Thermoprotei archaeon]
MVATALLINALALICLIFARVKDKKRTVQALRIAVKSLIDILPMVFVIIIFIGLMLGLVPPGEIPRFVGEQTGLRGILLVGVLGAVMYIPSLLSFPLAASLLEKGASIGAVAAFITTLTMIGVVTLPLEMKELGKEMVFLRNALGFVTAIAIALIMGALL